MFDFCLSKNKDFQCGALLKMLSSSPSMEEFELDIQNYISLKKAKTIFPEIEKHTKNKGFKGNYSIQGGCLLHCIFIIITV